MKRLTLELLLLLLFLVLVFSAFEWSYRNKQSQYDIVFKHLEEQQDSLEQISIGNSHIGALLQLGVWDSVRVFNLGLGGQDLFHMLAILEKCMPECRQLKTVLLGLDYDLLGYNFNTENQVWKDRQYYPYTGKLYDSSMINCLAAQSSFLRLNRDLRYLLAPDNQHTKGASAENKFIPPGANGSTQAAARQRAIEHSVSKYNSALIPENMRYLEQIIVLCKQRDVQLIVINTPKQSGYVQSYDQAVKDTAKISIESLLKHYDQTYLDYFNNSRFTSNDFIDADHLNSTGGEKLVQLMREDMSRL